MRIDDRLLGRMVLVVIAFVGAKLAPPEWVPCLNERRRMFEAASEFDSE